MRKLLRLASVLSLVAILASACVPATPASSEPTVIEITRIVQGTPQVITATPAPTTPADIEGTILVDGSSTVAPITAAIAEEFQSEYPNVRVPVGISGTGGGFKKFCNGETDISNASRPIKESEARTLQAE